jgi:hypothetical protein
MTDKLEAVDFYSGHKDTLKYLGTAWVEDGSPEGLRARQRFTDESLPEDEIYVEADYLAAVEQIMARADNSTNGSKEWPHPYRNSIKTPWSYRFQAGTVLIYQGGYLVQTVLCNGSREPYQYFPNLGTRAVAR